MKKSVNNSADMRLRSYSSAFSRSVFADIIGFDDFAHINWLLEHEDSIIEFESYFDYFSYIYSCLKNRYQCEYIFKNEIIGNYIIEILGTKNSIVFNEFRAGESIVDIAMMNGESKAFEIKTDFDTPKRLLKQLDDYRKIFNRVYIVVSADKYCQYNELISDDIGILILASERGHTKIELFKEAEKNDILDPLSLIRSLRTTEYKNIVKTFFGSLPEIEKDLFNTCLEAFKCIPHEELNKLYLNEIKKRRNITPDLKNLPPFLRQICLSMNLTQTQAEQLIIKLKIPIKNSNICISRI